MLPTGDPLGTVVTMLATPFGRLDGLAMDTAGAGGWLPTGSPPDSPSEGVIDGLPGSVSFPRRKVVVDGPSMGGSGKWDRSDIAMGGPADVQPSSYGQAF